MSKRKIREAVEHLDRLVLKVAAINPELALEFDVLRSKIVRIESNEDWREDLAFYADIAHTMRELAGWLGVSVRTVSEELRKRGVPPVKAGLKSRGNRRLFRIPVPDVKPCK